MNSGRNVCCLADTLCVTQRVPLARGSDHEALDVGRIRIGIDPGGKVIEAANADGGCGGGSPEGGP